MTTSLYSLARLLEIFSAQTTSEMANPAAPLRAPQVTLTKQVTEGHFDIEATSDAGVERWIWRDYEYIPE